MAHSFSRIMGSAADNGAQPKSTFQRCANVIAESLPILLLVAVLTVAALIVSPKKPMWNDELFSYYFLSAESFATLWRGFHDKLNNTPFAYFGLGWLWAKIFGDTALSLRLFSSLTISLAAVLTWLVLRRSFGFWAAVFGCLAVYGSSTLILEQNVEARMYGLFMAAFALAILLFDRLVRRRKPPFSLIVLNTLAHALIVHTHLFGVFYSGAIALALLVSDLSKGVTDSRQLIFARRAIYLSLAVAWVSFLLYLPAFLVQADAGRPYSWMPRPVLSDLARLWTQASGDFFQPGVLVLLVVLAGIARLFPVSERTGTQARSREVRHLIWLALILVILPTALWAASQIARPIFFPRYMLPSAIGWAILIAAVANRLLPHEPSLWILRVGRSAVLAGGAAVLLCVPLKRAIDYKGRYVPGTTDDDLTAAYSHLPMVVQSSGGFLERQYHSPTPRRYYYVMDWSSTNTPVSGRFGIQQYKHMEAWARVFPSRFSGNIVSADTFLASHDEFLVLTTADYMIECKIDVRGLDLVDDWAQLDCPQWVSKRLIRNPEWKVTHLGEKWSEALLLVRRNFPTGPD